MQVETNQEGASFCYSNLHANCPDSPNGTEVKRFQYYVCLKPKEAKDTRKIQKNRFIQADFPENICSIDIFCYKEQIKVAFTIGTSNQKQVLLGYQLLIVVSLNHYNLLDYADT